MDPVVLLRTTDIDVNANLAANLAAPCGLQVEVSFPKDILPSVANVLYDLDHLWMTVPERLKWLETVTASPGSVVAVVSYLLDKDYILTLAKKGVIAARNLTPDLFACLASVITGDDLAAAA